MFKRLGTFAVLAVCLFAIAMVGCNGDNGDDEDEKKIVVPPVEETKVETPMEKLDGLYTLVEMRQGNEIARPPDMTGDLSLYSLDGYPYSLSLTIAGNRLGLVTGTWSADETHITLGGDRSPYSWDGTHLTFAVPIDGGLANVKWRQTRAF